MRTARTGSLSSGASAYTRCAAGTASKLSAAAARTCASASRVAWIRSAMPVLPSPRSSASADARTIGRLRGIDGELGQCLVAPAAGPRARRRIPRRSELPGVAWARTSEPPDRLPTAQACRRGRWCTRWACRSSPTGPAAARAGCDRAAPAPACRSWPACGSSRTTRRPSLG